MRLLAAAPETLSCFYLRLQWRAAVSRQESNWEHWRRSAASQWRLDGDWAQTEDGGHSTEAIYSRCDQDYEDFHILLWELRIYLDRAGSDCEDKPKLWFSFCPVWKKCVLRWLNEAIKLVWVQISCWHGARSLLIHITDYHLWGTRWLAG